MDNHQLFLSQAIDLAKYSIKHQGGPFGAVIVKAGKIIGEGFNQVTSHNDPTAHAEMVAIRNACENIQSFQLESCILYASSEPCPMCLSAIYWAKIPIIYYANSCELAKQAGFDDSFIYQELSLADKQKAIKIIATKDQKIKKSAADIFELWKNNEDKVAY